MFTQKHMSSSLNYEKYIIFDEYNFLSASRIRWRIKLFFSFSYREYMIIIHLFIIIRSIVINVCSYRIKLIWYVLFNETTLILLNSYHYIKSLHVSSTRFSKFIRCFTSVNYRIKFLIFSIYFVKSFRLWILIQTDILYSWCITLIFFRFNDWISYFFSCSLN